MARGTKTGGGLRTGSKNIDRLSIEAKLAALGCDPIEGLARIAIDESIEMGLRVKCYSELAGYIAPKRKAVEHSGPDGGAITIASIIAAANQSAQSE